MTRNSKSKNTVEKTENNIIVPSPKEREKEQYIVCYTVDFN
jgi:hypothetical protein